MAYVLLLHVLFAFINPVIDRRIAYNDFRSNPYLHFDVGLVPRALGVQLDEFYCLVCSFIIFPYHASIVYYFITVVDYIIVLILCLSVVMTRWDTVTTIYVRNYELKFLEIDWIKSGFIYLFNFLLETVVSHYIINNVFLINIS